MYASAFTIGMGYLLGGLIPLLPYFFTPKASTGLLWSCIVTAFVLLVFGAVKTHITGGTGGFKVRRHVRHPSVADSLEGVHLGRRFYPRCRRVRCWRGLGRRQGARGMSADADKGFPSS